MHTVGETVERLFSSLADVWKALRGVGAGAPLPPSRGDAYLSMQDDTVNLTRINGAGCDVSGVFFLWNC